MAQHPRLRPHFTAMLQNRDPPSRHAMQLRHMTAPIRRPIGARDACALTPVRDRAAADDGAEFDFRSRVFGGNPGKSLSATKLNGKAKFTEEFTRILRILTESIGITVITFLAECVTFRYKNGNSLKI